MIFKLTRTFNSVLMCILYIILCHKAVNWTICNICLIKKPTDLDFWYTLYNPVYILSAFFI